jgi:diacylglycerol kinase
MKSGNFSMKSRFKSFGYAINGLKLLLKFEHNSRIHLLAAIIAVSLGIILKISLLEWSLLTVVTGLVFLSELINSSIENLADFISAENSEQIRKAKDYAAAAVLMAAVIAVIVGGLIFIPHLIVVFYSS